MTLRFLKARKKDGFLNGISIFSFIGISLGVAVLIIVMSVMNGFRTELINKIVGFNSHITVKPYSNSIDEDKINNKLKLISKNIIFSNSGEAIILKNNNTKGIVLRGYKHNDLLHLEVLTNEKIKGELKKYSYKLTKKKELVVLNKTDLIDKNYIKKIIKESSKITSSEVILLSTLKKSSISQVKAKLISYAS